MEVAAHPYLAGVLCRSGGAIFVPSGGAGPSSHWTYGTRDKKGYRVVRIARKDYKAHRLVAESFHGLCPEGCETDHINRCRDDNRPENLRWATRSENMRNRATYSKLGIRQCEDRPAYMRAYRAANPEFHERCKARDREYYRSRRKDPEFREKERERHRAYRAKKKGKEK